MKHNETEARLTFNQGVVGSSPTGLTNLIKDLGAFPNLTNEALFVWGHAGGHVCAPFLPSGVRAGDVPMAGLPTVGIVWRTAHIRESAERPRGSERRAQLKHHRMDAQPHCSVIRGFPPLAGLVAS